jgi:hypothetical protein
MVNIVENVATQEDLVLWDQICSQMALLKAQETLLRGKIYRTFFPDAREGTNTVPLANGYVLKGVRKVDRKLDIAVLTTLSAELEAAGVSTAQIVKWTPELKTTAYKELTEEQKLIFDQALIIKDGSPSLTISLPAANKPKEA